jgi:hypothetical protein
MQGVGVCYRLCEVLIPEFISSVTEYSNVRERWPEWMW